MLRFSLARGHQGNIKFGTWFLYGANTQGTFLVFAGPLQKNAQGKDAYAGGLYRAHGPQPATYDAAQFHPEAAVGTMSIVFDSASSATMTYSFTDENSEVQAGELQLYPYQFGCALPGAWNGSLCVFPMGDKIGNVQQLPAGCDTFRDACWKAAIAAGTVKFIATSAMMTGYSNRPVVFAYFKNTTTASGVTGLWNSLPVYADDASPAAYDIGGGFVSQIDRVYGTPNGIILHDASSGLCAEWAWNATSLTWAINGTGVSTPIPCPQ